MKMKMFEVDSEEGEEEKSAEAKSDDGFEVVEESSEGS